MYKHGRAEAKNENILVPWGISVRRLHEHLIFENVLFHYRYIDSAMLRGLIACIIFMKTSLNKKALSYAYVDSILLRPSCIMSVHRAIGSSTATDGSSVMNTPVSSTLM